VHEREVRLRHGVARVESDGLFENPHRLLPSAKLGEHDAGIAMDERVARSHRERALELDERLTLAAPLRKGDAQVHLGVEVRRVVAQRFAERLDRLRRAARLVVGPSEIGEPLCFVRRCRARPRPAHGELAGLAVRQASASNPATASRSNGQA
jgi:hypothetical protein